MNGTTFDAPGAAPTLREAGFGDRQAEAVAGVMRQAVDADRDKLATKADIAMLRADLDTGLARLESRLPARMVAMGGAIVAVTAALKLFAQTAKGRGEPGPAALAGISCSTPAPFCCL